MSAHFKVFPWLLFTAKRCLWSSGPVTMLCTQTATQDQLPGGHSQVCRIFMANIFKAEFFSKLSSTLTWTILNQACQLETTGSKAPIRNKSSYLWFICLLDPSHASVCVTGMSLRVLPSAHSQINHQINNTIIQRMALPTLPNNILPLLREIIQQKRKI